MRRKTVIVMVKEPRPGRVKTRLGRDIGMVSAAWWFRHQTETLLRRLRDPRWDLCMAVSPDREGLLSRVWPEDLRRVPQGTGDLGDRMKRVFRSTSGPTLIIGADIPLIAKRDISFAFQALGHSSSVLGPAPDGGYWLIGLAHPLRMPNSIFDGVRWSTEFAMAETEVTLPKPVAYAKTLRDVDTKSDL